MLTLSFLENNNFIFLGSVRLVYYTSMHCVFNRIRVNKESKSQLKSFEHIHLRIKLNIYSKDLTPFVFVTKKVKG